MLLPVLHTANQCCGSMTFCYGSGSGSADPCLRLIDKDPGLRLMDPDSDPDPAIFVIELQEAFCLVFFDGTFTSFLKIKSKKKKIKSKKKDDSRNQDFS
jgi:hypothetical protein